jgi:hypothetical protein
MWRVLMMWALTDGIDVPRWVSADLQRREVMSKTVTVGLDLASTVFQAQGADAGRPGEHHGGGASQ